MKERSGRVADTNTFIMKPKIDFCFKELMEFAEVRRGFIAAVLGISPTITHTSHDHCALSYYIMHL